MSCGPKHLGTYWPWKLETRKHVPGHGTGASSRACSTLARSHSPDGKPCSMTFRYPPSFLPLQRRDNLRFVLFDDPSCLFPRYWNAPAIETSFPSGFHTMSAPTRLAASRLCLLRSISPNASRGFTGTSCAAKDEAWPQRSPLGAYYESVLRNPIPYAFNEKPEEPPSSADPDVLPPGRKPESAPAPSGTKKKPSRRPKSDASSASPTPSESPSTSPPAPSPPPATAAEKARIVFGSRLLGPAEQADRLATKTAQSIYVAGVLVPPRPEEPDNCCMSGCVNCVWDRFRDDMEEWSAKKNEAQTRLMAGSKTMDADGGGSEASWGVNIGSSKITKDMWDEDVFQSVPVGIREFMKQEKRLKEKHQREGSVGG